MNSARSERAARAAKMDENVKAFKELTGSDAATAERMLAASNGDLERALALHFDVAGDEQMPSAADEEEEQRTRV